MGNYTPTADVRAFIRDMMANSHLNNRLTDHLTWITALDNHIPSPRNFGSGFAIRYSNDIVTDGIVLWHDDYFGDNRKLAFLADDGTKVKLYRLGSWSESGKFFILHPAESNGVTFGPHKMYHLRIKRETWV